MDLEHFNQAKYAFFSSEVFQVPSLHSAACLHLVRADQVEYRFVVLFPMAYLICCRSSSYVPGLMAVGNVVPM